jgi:predicted unusual protein kinase regulating ubiquinone biosynthesis (AarF/ABC1/UbiB family)
MEYVPGIKINRIQQIDKLGLDRKRYALNTSQAQL